MMRRLLLASALSVLTLGAAQAGEQYVDETGFALSGYDPVAYFDLKQVPVGQHQPEAVPGNPNLWRIVDGKLYLNITPTVVGFWESDISGNLTKAESNWQAKEAAPASSKSWKAIEDNKSTYTVSAPVTN